MKAENHQAQWKDILEQTKTFKDQHQVKARYKELTGHKKEEGKDDSNEGPKGKKKDKDPDRAAKDAKNREEGLKRAKSGQGQQSEDAKNEKKKVLTMNSYGVVL